MLLIQDLALGPGTICLQLPAIPVPWGPGDPGCLQASLQGTHKLTQAHTLKKKKKGQPEGSRKVDVVTACCSLATWVAELGGSLENSLNNTVVPCLIKQNSVSSKQ